MCGIFGYIGHKGESVNVSVLTAIAERTETRGNHAFGFAWVDAKGAVRMFKDRGCPSKNRTAFLQLRGARAVIGHCRWVTHGDVSNPLNNHPHASGEGFIVHNGIVRNYLELFAAHNLQPRTECDSEVIGTLFARGKKPFKARVRRALGKIDGGFGLAVAALEPTEGVVAIVRRGNPVSVSESKHGRYFASEASALSGFVLLDKPEAFPDSYVGLFPYGKSRTRTTVEMFKAPAGPAFEGRYGTRVSGPCGSPRSRTRVSFGEGMNIFDDYEDPSEEKIAGYDPEYRRLLYGDSKPGPLFGEETVNRQLARKKTVKPIEQVVDELFGEEPEEDEGGAL